MKTCPKCNTPRTGADNFCLNCGSKFENENLNTSVKEAKQPEIPSQIRRKRLFGITAFVLLLLVIAGTHFYLQSKYNASKELIEMNQAFVENEPTEFLSFFTTDENVIADEKAFISFVEKEDWEDIREQLKSEVENLNKEGFSDVIVDSDGNKLFSVIRKPVLLGLYKETSFLVHPVDVQAELPFDQTTLAIDEKTIKGNEGEIVSLGEFLPGTYEWKASVKSEYSQAENDGTTEILGDGSNKFTFIPSLEAGVVTVTSDIENAILWIDGKSTGQALKDMNTIGPLPFDGTVKITAEGKDENNSIVKGETVAVSNANIHISFAHIQEKNAATQKEKQESAQLQQLVTEHETWINDLIQSFRYEFETALNYGDFSYISSFFPIGSPIQAEYMAKMENHLNSTDYYEYDFQSTTVTNIQAINQNNFQVNTSEVFYYSLNDADMIYKKTKVYTVQLGSDGSGYHITDIKELSSDITDF